MIIVLGPGFCGTNAIVKELMDLGYFMGKDWVLHDVKQTKMHPYTVYEDNDWYNLVQNIDHPHLSYWIKKLTEERVSIYGRNWGFKCPNFWYHLTTFLPIIEGSLPEDTIIKIIACDRDPESLVDRMMDRWKMTEKNALARVRMYHAIVEKLEHLLPVFWVDQQRLLYQRDLVMKDLKEWKI